MTKDQIQRWQTAILRAAHTCGVADILFAAPEPHLLDATFGFTTGTLHIQAGPGANNLHILPSEPHISIHRMIALMEEICAAHRKWAADTCP